ncbi:MAG: glycosyl transferase family 51, partial [Gemmatimonadales bacterium]
MVYSGAASWASARLLSDYVTGISFAPEAGPSSHPAVAATGPLDIRLGYHGLPQAIERLQAREFSITSQARISERFNWVANRGLYPPYREKTQAGLRILGHNGSLISSSRFPKHVYTSFEAIPPPVAQTLLFLENRELLDERYPFRNPAIEWDRLVAAVANFAGGKILGGSGRFGASTLATQLEKLRHSPDGITRSPSDKAKQMASATLRSYVEGPRTSDVRRRILTDYLNALPVGALPGYGEIIGLRDGLLVWFGIDPDSADAQLQAAASGSVTPEAAKSYRAVLMLLLAQRRPSHYFQTDGGRAALVALTDSHLRLMAGEAVVSDALARAALGARLEIQSKGPPLPPTTFVERKAINAVRSHLVDLLGAPGVYQLDRFDLTVRTTIDSAAQRSATELIRQLADPSFVQSSGLGGARLLGEEDPRQVSYSFVLYEREPLGNAIRVQVDNLERPFDLNSGARLELGSTAKLRTLVTYLEILSAVHAELTDSLASDSTRARRAGDPITLWARQYVSSHQGVGLRQFLEAGLERRYSASPSETFFTGGGTHVFGNFDDTHDHETPTVLEGLRHSVNLVYVRLMRDLVRFHEQRIPGYDPGLLQDSSNPARRVFLERFIDQEGRQLVA